MNEFTGSILELNKKHAIVMTDSCDFVTIQRQPQMFVGQQVKFRKSDIVRTNSSYMRYTALAASVFIMVLCSVFYFQIFIPSAVFAYVDVDINPSVEFSIDKNAQVLDLKPLNPDAQMLLKDLELVDLPISEAITEVVKASKQLGFISKSKENTVLISASMNDDIKYKSNDPEKITFDKIISDISSVTFDVGTESINAEIIKVTSENRKSAVKNKLSMGRYSLYSKIKADNNDITVEKAKTEHISDMLDKAKIKESKKIKANESDSKASEPKGNKEAEHNDSKGAASKYSDSEITNSKDTGTKNNSSKTTKSKSDHSKRTDSKKDDSAYNDSKIASSKNTASKSNNYKKNKSQNTNSKHNKTKNVDSSNTEAKSNDSKGTNSNPENSDSKNNNSKNNNSENNDSKNTNNNNDASKNTDTKNDKDNSNDSIITNNKGTENSNSTDDKDIQTNATDNTKENTSSNNEQDKKSNNSEKEKKTK